MCLSYRLPRLEDTRTDVVLYSCALRAVAASGRWQAALALLQAVRGSHGVIFMGFLQCEAPQL